MSIIVIIHLLCTINQLRYTRDANIPSLLIKDYYAIKCQWPFRKYKLFYFIKKISRQLVHAVQKCCISFLLHYISKQGRICICEVNGMVRYNSCWQMKEWPKMWNLWFPKNLHFVIWIRFFNRNARLPTYTIVNLRMHLTKIVVWYYHNLELVFYFTGHCQKICITLIEYMEKGQSKM